MSEQQKRLFIASHPIEEDEDRETPNEYNKRKNNERKTVDTKTITWTIYQANNG